MNFDALKRFMDSLPGRGIPGADVLVQQKGRTLFRYQSGLRDREAGLPMRGDELYFMYSCSKPVTCAAALQLYEQGAFLLTDPLGDYIPEYREMTVRQSDDTLKKAENPITIRHLFTMTAGLDYDLASEPLLQAAKETGGRCPTVPMIRALARKPLDFEPGTHFQYSLCHDVLAALVEVISGERFCDYVKNHIFDPLGMKDSTFHMQPEERFAAQYQYSDEKQIAERVPLTAAYRLGEEYDSGGAGVISTVADYALFADAMANGGVGATGRRILASSTIDLMRRNQLNEAQMADFNWIQMTGYGYGLGVRTMIDPAKGGAFSPIGEFGWGGAAGAYLHIDPENGLSIVYGQHMLNNMEPYVHPRLRNIVYPCMEY